uniref:Uncharacterized protein n=1 Tax=Strigamia maritima TaxID=126957 RepID=T1IQ21_STRMM
MDLQDEIPSTENARINNALRRATSVSSECDVPNEVGNTSPADFPFYMELQNCSTELDQREDVSKRWEMNYHEAAIFLEYVINSTYTDTSRITVLQKSHQQMNTFEQQTETANWNLNMDLNILQIILKASVLLSNVISELRDVNRNFVTVEISDVLRLFNKYKHKKTEYRNTFNDELVCGILVRIRLPNNSSTGENPFANGGARNYCSA